MADIPTVELNEDSPAGGDNIALGDNRIREYKTQNREILEVDHDYPSSGQSETAGQHKKVTLQERADLGTGAEGVPILGAQTVDGKAELVFTDEDDNDVQVTDNGKIRQQSVSDIPNTTTLKSIDAAGTGTVDLINANASDQAVLPTVTLAEGGVILPEITLPVTGANQGALYTKNDGTQTELYFGEESAGDEVQITKGGRVNNSFGAWVDKSASYGAQQAATDGFVLAHITYTGTDSEGAVTGYTDGNADPTTIRCRDAVGRVSNYEGYIQYGSITMPVKKSDYWKVVVAGNYTGLAVYWIPLGT